MPATSQQMTCTIKGATIQENCIRLVAANALTELAMVIPGTMLTPFPGDPKCPAGIELPIPGYMSQIFPYLC